MIKRLLIPLTFLAVVLGLVAAPPPAAAGPTPTRVAEAQAWRSTAPATAAIAQAEPVAALGLNVRNDNFNRWLRVRNGNGAWLDIAPQSSRSVSSGSASRAVWVQARCSLFKDGVHWASAQWQNGYWKNFGWQITTVNFQHYQCN